MSLDKNYQGTDVNLETSLEEYGFVARPITVDYADEYFVIYKMDDNQYGSGHIRESELDAIVNGTEWASEEDVNSMLETVGASKEEWMDLPFTSKFSDLVSYWGTENIMGTDYYPNDKNWAFEEIGLESDGMDLDDLVDYVVPTHYATALINGDYSGLSDEEEQELNEFTETVIERTGNANFMLGNNDEGEYFSPANDINNLGSSVMKVYIRPSNEYKRGGFIYEVQKKGSPSNDMRETMFTAKNLTELKKKIIEKYGTSEGFLVSRRTEQGYYASVKFEDGGGVDNFEKGDKFRVLKGIYGDYNSPRYANKEFEVINIRDGKYIDAKTDRGTTETFEVKNIEKLSFAKGGGVGNEYLDLFEDYENIPPHIQAILQKYEMEDNDYNVLGDLQEELEEQGYTFDFGLDATPYGLRPIGVDLNQLKGYEEEYAKGGGVERLVGSFYYDTRKDKTFRVISVDGTDRNGNKRKDGVINIGIQYYDKNKQPIGSIESIDKDTFDYYVSMGAWGEYKQSYFKDGGMFEAPIGMMKPVSGKVVISVPVYGDILSSEITDFVNYIYDFYDEEFTKQEIKTAVNKYLKNLDENNTYGGGDSTDRERVYNKYLAILSIKKSYEKGLITKSEYEGLIKEQENKFAKGGGVGNVSYGKIYEVLKENIDESIDDLGRTYENSSDFTGEEIEHKFRDGFIPYTNGGYELSWYEYVSTLNSTGYTLPTEKLQAEMQRHVDYSYELAKDTFKETYPEIVDVVGEDNIDYNSLDEAGFTDEAQELSDWEMEYLSDEDTIRCSIIAYYYEPTNEKGQDGKHTISLQGDINLEAPYHRKGKNDDFTEIIFTFDSIEELKSKLEDGLKNVIDWFNGSKPTGSDDTFAKGGGVKGMKLPKDAKIRINYVDVSVYKDSYEDGETDNVNNYDMNHIKGSIVTPKELVSFLAKNIYTSDNPADYVILDNNIHTSQLQDVDGSEASDSERERWMKGNLELYSANFVISVSIISEIDFDEEVLSSLTGIGVYKKGGKVKSKTPKMVRTQFEEGEYEYADGGGVDKIKVGAKLGILNSRNGRYRYSIIEDIKGENVFLVEKHPTRSQWDNHWETTKSNINRFLNEDNEDFKSKKSYVLKYADGGRIDEIEKITDHNFNNIAGFTKDLVYKKGNILVQRIGGSTMWSVAIDNKPKGRVLNAFTQEQAFKKVEKEKFADGGGVELNGKKVGVAKRLKIKNWYLKTYPTDDLGKEIKDNLSFWSLYTLMSQRYNVYSVLQVSDSLVRERVFEKLSEILGVEYDYIYKIWLKSSDEYAKGGGVDGFLKFTYNKEDFEIKYPNGDEWSNNGMVNFETGVTDALRITKFFPPARKNNFSVSINNASELSKSELTKLVSEKIKGLNEEFNDYKRGYSYSNGGGVDDDILTHQIFFITDKNGVPLGYNNGYILAFNTDNLLRHQQDWEGETSDFDVVSEKLLLDNNYDLNDVYGTIYYDATKGEKIVFGEELKEPYRSFYLKQIKENSFANGGGVDDADWIEESLIDLQNEVDMDDLVVENSNNNHYTASNGNAEFEVFETEDDARERAIERVKEDLEENPEYFNRTWIMNYIDGNDFFTDVYNEWNYGYVNDIENEGSDEYSNRLIEEMVENGIISSEEAKEQDFDAEDYKDSFVELLTNNQIEEGNGGLQHYIDNFGEEQAFKVVLDNNLIDTDFASKDAVDTDGIAHFLSSYDGEQIDLSNGHVAYRTN